MFKRILIANRGEIACRIIKTARKMGIETVAVYSEVDKQALHVNMADYAYPIGEAAASASYLNIDNMIAAALACQAEAIHPGYGFLSENPGFAKACEKAKIQWIGPGVAALEAMASKQSAKQLLEKTTVPLTPGYHGKEQSDEILIKNAKAIGLPVLLKAANGGGGKGMRVVREEKALAPAIAAARRESLASFADDTLIIEKFVEHARHVEVQILADTQGHVLHLFERDCSIQRRHQKIIEEAPAPLLSASLRQSLAQAAIDTAGAIDYVGAGTVEFLVDNDQFYFMEMNTRLQVEHPVTEMITGLDLVEWQIRIAAGEALSIQQQDIKATGHAIECRIYAEDPAQQFMPATGTIDFLQYPEASDTRIDSGIALGSEISQYYDPMMAKLIVKGRDRDDALQKMRQALAGFYLHGVKSNIPFLMGICAQPDFAKARLSTAFLDEKTITISEIDRHSALVFASSLHYWQTRAQHADPLFQDCFSWQMNLKRRWHWRFLMAEQECEVIIQPLDHQNFILYLDENPLSLHFEITENRMTVHDGRQRMQAGFFIKDEGFTLFSAAASIEIQAIRWQSMDAADSQKNRLTAPMPATVVAIFKNKGDKVKAGEKLMVLEAMKMEHSIQAPFDGCLTDLFYAVGAQVNEGAELLKLESTTEKDEASCL